MEWNTAFAILAAIAWIRWFMHWEHASNAIVLVAASVAFFITK